MSFREPARALGATGRADLLRLLATTSRDALALDVDASGWFGYVRRPQPPPQLTLTQDEPSVGPAAKPALERKPPLRLPFVPAIVRREPRQTPAHDATTEESFASAAPIDEAAARSPSDKRLIAYQDLLPPARLIPALRRFLGAYRSGPLDVERLTALLAAGQLPPRLPRRRYRRWHPGLVVLLDFCPRLWPYRWDMHRLAERLLRHVGRSGVSLRIVNNGPTAPWSDWLAQQNRPTAVAPVERAWRMPPAGTPVLIVSDLGLLLRPHSEPAQTWAQFVRDLIHAQVRPLALVPLGAGQLGEPVPPSLPVLRWSPDARPRPICVRGTAAAEPDGLDDLLAMVAATRRVDPPLLRAMRRLNPRAPLNAGLEGALWCHADVEAVHTASIRPEAVERRLPHFAERLGHLHAALDRERTRHHAHLRAVLNHEETLLWRAQVSEETFARCPGAAERVAEARKFMRRLAATLTFSDGGRPRSIGGASRRGLCTAPIAACGSATAMSCTGCSRLRFARRVRCPLSRKRPIRRCWRGYCPPAPRCPAGWCRMPRVAICCCRPSPPVPASPRSVKPWCSMPAAWGSAWRALGAGGSRRMTCRCALPPSTRPLSLISKQPTSRCRLVQFAGLSAHSAGARRARASPSRAPSSGRGR